MCAKCGKILSEHFDGGLEDHKFVTEGQFAKEHFGHRSREKLNQAFNRRARRG